jgi:hypothetical protein
MNRKREIAANVYGKVLDDPSQLQRRGSDDPEARAKGG